MNNIIKVEQIAAGGGFVYVLTDKKTIIQFEQKDFEPNAEYIITKDMKTNEIKLEKSETDGDNSADSTEELTGGRSNLG